MTRLALTEAGRIMYADVCILSPSPPKQLRTDACTGRLHLHYLASPLKKIGHFHRGTQKLKQTKFQADLGWDEYAHDLL